MAIMMGRLYAALRAADVPEDTATAAAEEVAGFETRLSSIDGRLTVLTWTVSVMATLLAIVGGPLVWLTLRIAAKVGAL